MGMRTTPKGFSSSWHDGKFRSIWGQRMSVCYVGSPRRIVLLPRTTDAPSRSGVSASIVSPRQVIRLVVSAIGSMPSHSASVSSAIRCLRDPLAARILVRCIRLIWGRSGPKYSGCHLSIGCCRVTDRPRRFAKNWTITPSQLVVSCLWKLLWYLENSMVHMSRTTRVSLNRMLKKSPSSKAAVDESTGGVASGLR